MFFTFVNRQFSHFSTVFCLLSVYQDNKTSKTEDFLLLLIILSSFIKEVKNKKRKGKRWVLKDSYITGSAVNLAAKVRGSIREGAVAVGD